VLLITTDQQQVGATSAAGNPLLKTPHMDSLAAQGVYFTKSYCAFPLCSPSRAALHTGRTPHEIKVDRNSVPVDPAMPLSGQVFCAAGYDTAYAGKWHLPNPYPSDGIAGFEVLNKTTRVGKLAHDVDDATMNTAIEFLKRKHDKPFYLVVSFINPHDICLLAGETSGLVHQVWKKYQPPVDAKLPPLPANFGKADGADPRGNKHSEWDDNHWQRYRYAYYRMVEDVDQQVGRVLETLRQIGQEDQTLIAFTSDHGEGLGSHRWTGKMMFYEEEAAVPLIISWKGVTPAARVDLDHLVSTLDVLPTLCDYAGIQPPPSMRGESLRAVIEKPEQPGHEFVVSEMAGGAAGGAERNFMLRTRQYKYLLFPGAAPQREMLFDLKADRIEMKNLVADPAAAGELEHHRQLLAQWKTTTEEDRYPLQAGKQAKGKRAKRKGANQ
jgi:arylsulfatase A-like enzyme